jgi:hypothetical protein
MSVDVPGPSGERLPSLADLNFSHSAFLTHCFRQVQCALVGIKALEHVQSASRRLPVRLIALQAQCQFFQWMWPRLKDEATPAGACGQSSRAQVRKQSGMYH